MYPKIFELAETFFKLAKKWDENDDITRKTRPPKKPKKDKESGSFNLDAFKNLKDFQAASNYVLAMLPVLGRGSSRIVYDLGGDKVLKLAFNDAGIAQNSLEARLTGRTPFFAHVYDMSPKGWWIISEKITPFKTAQEFTDYTGLEMPLLRDYGYERLTTEERQEFKDYYGLNDRHMELLDSIVHMLRTYNLIGGDTTSIKHWGLNNNNELKLYDYGLDKTLFETFKETVNPIEWAKEKGLPVPEEKPSESEEEEMANYDPANESLNGGAMFI